jgi:hypothetical protein
MVSVNYRGWAFIDEDAAPDPESSRGVAVTARAQALMDEWSRLHHDEEQEGFRRMARFDDGDCDDYDPRICECGEGAEQDGDELCVHDRKALNDVAAAEELKEQGRRVRMELIEHELASFNVRKMRANEGNQELESYYQWMEEGRFGHYSE